MFAAINILLAAFTWFFVPETKQVSLEEMDALFGGKKHVTEGAAIEKGEERGVSVGGESVGEEGATDRVERV